MIITFQKLGERIGIKKELLYLYLGHFSLTKHVISSFEKKHAKVVILSQDFITDFINYLAKPRRKRKLNNEEIFLIKKELEELLKCEIHQGMRGITCTNPPTIALNVGKSL